MNTQVIDIIAATFSIEGASLQPSSGPHDIPGWDSAGHMRMIMELEDAFDLEIPDDQIARFITVEVINAFIESQG